MFTLMYLWLHFLVKMSALGLGEEEDVESPWDSEVLSFIIILSSVMIVIFNITMQES